MTDTAAPDTGIGGCREVGPGESRAVSDVLASDPLVAAPAAEKFATSGVVAGADGRFLTLGGPARSLVFVGSSVLPLRGDDADHRALGRAVAGLGLGPMSVHGRREQVASLWPALRDAWGEAREYRDQQYLMTLERPVDPAMIPDGIRPATLEEFEPVLAAAAAMYREELRADPFAVGAGIPFRRRVARSLARGRTWIGLDRGEVVFKADIAALAPRVAQIQGIWVHRDKRGAGLGSGGTAAVCAALRSHGLTPSLVVNGSNVAARAAYRRVGMTDAVDYATVLL
ncbi:MULTISPECIES: GNAT family N-acetyltransferase [Dietzia]|uniref:GNAT family N-acetyltransferase n=4 Tax=Dietzia cinnamea TaxID=321318 RepID=A0A4R3ZYY9_9ACTN|nr:MULTISPECIES: GNAT family N-acetyltransferase [Dietzia]KZO59582.1 GCN5 family acetyltransferase [Dietzia maris]MCT1865014.1 GNAT family N-acetyltransferase [Dietzia cinnamea]MCT1885479.1 GNAT family N-acetyltransferase [Dietzia cinnamea]MCT2033974.1 GNAT family N-acetyltransferase [Dietzia cinnamea]MCT2059356.1 GNAT family N-acetyltransferase [Dietzia cinnamea]